MREPRIDEHEADYVVVGGGSAGCVLAARLSEDPAVRVDLIEAGEHGRSPWIKIPAGFGKLMAAGHYFWHYQTEPEPHLNDRSVYWPRGKVVGGSGAINGLVYLRGAPSDYGGWLKDGAHGWSWDDVVPYFRRLEDWGGAPGLTRGKNGPIPINQSRKVGIGAAAFIESCRSLGFPAHRDVNDGDIEGVSQVQSNVRNGVRVSSSQGYLAEALGRPNLRVVTNANAQRILFKERRAVGVVVKRVGTDCEEVYKARREVVLCAGAVGSPQMLMLSGVGDSEQLARCDIQTVVHSPSVGKNLQDHLISKIKFQSRPIRTWNEVLNSTPRLALTAIGYALGKDGPLAKGPAEAILFAKSSPNEHEADVQLSFVNFCTDERPGFQLPDFPGFTLVFDQCRPESRGQLSLSSNDPSKPPRICANYLSTERDRDAMLYGARLARRIARSGALGRLVEQELAPARELESDDELLEYIKGGATTVYHPCGTCRMGEDDAAVVDSELRVRGVDRLRVADASVMPRILSGNIHAGVLMIAEKAVDHILGR
jgi:choline dehydrogenase